jgi:LysM repeat protein
MTMTPTVVPSVTQTPTLTYTPTPTAAVSPTATPSSTEFTYIVRTGDTLWGLAIRFGTTVEAIKSRNGLTSDIIYKGQKLVVPGADPGSGQTVTHVVQPGENLWRIALKYGTTPEAIAAANSIVNPNIIYPGQKLVITTGTTTPGPGTRYHVVQPGESLWSIALRYGTTPWKIAAANGISNIHYIYAGQTLRIP